MSAEENKATFRRYVEEGWAKGSVEVADEVFADRYVAHSPTAPRRSAVPKTSSNSSATTARLSRICRSL